MGTVTEERRNPGGQTPVDAGRGLPGVRVTGKAWERRCIQEWGIVEIGLWQDRHWGQGETGQGWKLMGLTAKEVKPRLGRQVVL